MRTIGLLVRHSTTAYQVKSAQALLRKILGKTSRKFWRENRKFAGNTPMAWKNIEELFKRLKIGNLCTDRDVMQYIEQPGLIIRIVACPKCRRIMRKKQETEMLVDYQCNHCSSFKRLLKFQNVFNVRLPILQLLRFLVIFTLNVNTDTMADLLDVAEGTMNTLVVTIQSLIRQKLAEVPIRLGGPGQVVQVDESYFGRRKYNTGRNQRFAWVFGAIDPINKEFVMRSVVNCKVETLGPLIQEFIAHDSNVHSDRHAAYLAFFSRTEEYIHGHVNHKVNFVDPETGVHTQNIENLWSQFKRFKRRKSYSKLCYLDQYIAEFTLRKRYDKKSKWKMFRDLLAMCIKLP